jgi:hypothetical protein
VVDLRDTIKEEIEEERMRATGGSYILKSLMSRGSQARGLLLLMVV